MPNSITHACPWISNPPQWGLARIGHLFDVTLGKMVNENRPHGEIHPYLRAANIQENGLDLTEVKQMPFLPEETKQLTLRRNDVVVVEGGAGYGRSDVLREDLTGWGFQNHIIRLRARYDDNPGFLHYWIMSLRSVGHIDAGTGFATIPNLSAERLSTSPILRPTSVEQAAIADFLDRETAEIDAFIADQERLIELLVERRVTTVDVALGETRFPRVPLRRCLRSIDQGVSPEAEATLADGADDVGVLKAGCVNGGVFRQVEHKRLPTGFAFDPAIEIHPGELLVNRASGSLDLLGSAAIVDTLKYRLILSDKIFRLNLRSNMLPSFLALVMLSATYRAQVRAGVSGAEGLANNLPMARLREFLVPAPPVDEQESLAAQLEVELRKTDVTIADARRAIELSRERRAALITAAVTGQVDVRAGRAKIVSASCQTGSHQDDGGSND